MDGLEGSGGLELKGCLFDHNGERIAFGEEGLGEIGGISVEIIIMARYATPR
jgi:hypothetical protein